MIAADTSSVIAFFEGQSGKDVELLDEALAARQVVMPPVVLTELLSDPKLPKPVREVLSELPLLAITSGYWERAGRNRAIIIASGLRARLADTLIAQSCLDHDVALLTRDQDFKHFVRLAGLRTVSQ